MKSKYIKDIFVIGFALFAMYFGAGNLIFPPYLGYITQNNWFIGFLLYIITDIGIAVFVLIIAVKMEDGAQSLTKKLGKRLSIIVLTLNTLCLGPLIAIPRTAATTYEFAIQPIFKNPNKVIFAIIFFILVVIFTISKTKVIDIVGAVLAPVMFLTLGYLILKGITISDVTIQGVTPAIKAVNEGISAGYQTMDAIASIIFSVSMLSCIKLKGYNEPKEKTNIMVLSSTVAAAVLFIVYGGLTYLGALSNGKYGTSISQSQLLLNINKDILGDSGVYILGIVVLFACFTTAIGLLSAASEFFADITNNKISYQLFVVLFAIISCVLSTVGLSNIIAFAAPILSVLYPVLLTVTFLSAVKNRYFDNYTYKLSCLMAVIISICEILNINMAFIGALPFANFGLAWVCPTFLLGWIGYIIDKRKINSN